MAADRRQALAMLLSALALPQAARSAEIITSLPSDLPPVLFPSESDFGPDPGPDELLATSDSLRRMTVPVRINGQGPFAFIIDTGANRSVIASQVVEQLGLPLGRMVKVNGIGGVRPAPTVKVSSFEVGARVSKSTTMVVVPGSALEAGGLLGVDGLKDQRIIMDFQGERLRIEPSKDDYRDPRKSTVVPARRRYGQLTVVDTDLMGERVSLILDTGADISIGNLALKNLMLRKVRELEGSVQMRGLFGDSLTGAYGLAPLFRLGDLELRNLRIFFADAHPFRLWDLERRPALLMGVEVMRFFERVTIDYGRSQARFTLPAQPYVDPASDARRS